MITTPATRTPIEPRVADDLHVSPAYVEALAGAAAEQPYAYRIHGEADDRDDEHRSTQDFGGLQEPAVGLVEDEHRDAEEKQAVGERGEDLDTVVAVALRGCRGLGGEPDGKEGQGETTDVGQHVSRVGH